MASAGMDTRNNLCGKPAMASRSFFALAFVYTAAILGGLAWLWFPSGAKIDWPAWVQAVGSVAAILAAVGISQWEATRARKDRFEDRQEHRRAVAALARRLADLICKTSTDMIQHPAYYHHEGLGYGEFKLLESALDRFDPSKLASADGVIALEQLRREANATSYFENMVVEVYNHERFDDGELTDWLEAWSKRAVEATVVLENLAK